MGSVSVEMWLAGWLGGGGGGWSGWVAIFVMLQKSVEMLNQPEMHEKFFQGGPYAANTLLSLLWVHVGQNSYCKLIVRDHCNHCRTVRVAPATLSRASLESR